MQIVKLGAFALLAAGRGAEVPRLVRVRDSQQAVAAFVLDRFHVRFWHSFTVWSSRNGRSTPKADVQRTTLVPHSRYA